MRTHAGVDQPGPAVCSDDAPGLRRHWKAVPLPGVTTTMAWRLPGARLSRIMTPALAQTSVLVWDTTRAVMLPSPLSGVWPYWNWSPAPQMSAPPPVTVQASSAPVVEPASAGAADVGAVEGDRPGGCGGPVELRDRLPAAFVVLHDDVVGPFEVAGRGVGRCACSLHASMTRSPSTHTRRRRRAGGELVGAVREVDRSGPAGGEVVERHAAARSAAAPVVVDRVLAAPQHGSPLRVRLAKWSTAHWPGAQVTGGGGGVGRLSPMTVQVQPAGVRSADLCMSPRTC